MVWYGMVWDGIKAATATLTHLAQKAPATVGSTIIIIQPSLSLSRSSYLPTNPSSLDKKFCGKKKDFTLSHKTSLSVALQPPPVFASLSPFRPRSLAICPARDLRVIWCLLDPDPTLLIVCSLNPQKKGRGSTGRVYFSAHISSSTTSTTDKELEDPHSPDSS